MSNDHPFSSAGMLSDPIGPGKGSRPRTWGETYRKNWDRIFRKKKPAPAPRARTGSILRKASS